MNSSMFDNEDNVTNITPRKDRKTMDREPFIVPEKFDHLKINEVVITLRGVTAHDYGYILNEAMRLCDKVTSYSE